MRKRRPAIVVQAAGGSAHEELWLPAEELDDFNRGIVGKIEVIATYKDRVKLPD